MNGSDLIGRRWIEITRELGSVTVTDSEGNNICKIESGPYLGLTFMFASGIKVQTGKGGVLRLASKCTHLCK